MLYKLKRSISNHYFFKQTLELLEVNVSIFLPGLDSVLVYELVDLEVGEEVFILNESVNNFCLANAFALVSIQQDE